MTSNLQFLLTTNDLQEEFVSELSNAEIEIETPSRRVRGEPLVDLVVTLGSAGVFTALYQIIFKLVEKNKDRSITIKFKKGEITINGHSLPEELDLLRIVAPELMDQKKPKRYKRE